MKKLLIVMLAVMAALPLAAATENFTDFAKAKAVAEKEKKPLMLIFSGSDWCPPCKMMHRKVLSSPEFAAFAGKKAVFVMLDYPRRKAQSREEKRRNEKLAAEFGIDSLPSVVMISANGTASKPYIPPVSSPAAFIARAEEVLSSLK